MAIDREASVAVVWDCAPGDGSVEVINGCLQALALEAGQGSASRQSVRIAPGPLARLRITVTDARLQAGANSTLVQLNFKKSPITFFLRDVNASTPIFIPEYGLAVIPAEDGRTFEQIAAAVRQRGLISQQQQYDDAPEETYEAAAANNRDLKCPTWLSVARDLRIFRVHHQEQFGYWGTIQPAFHSLRCTLPETDNQPYSLDFAVGPGAGCKVEISRRLEEGTLPILRSTQREGDVQYHLIAFATLETKPLSAAAVRGSDWRAAYAMTGGNMYTAEDHAKLKDLIERETRAREEELVCCIRVEAVNSGRVPRYAWLRALRISNAKAQQYDGSRGFSSVGPDGVFAIHRLNGRPLPQEEVAVLLQPGEAATFELIVPHQPISEVRAGKLAALDYQAHLEACRNFWREKLASAAQISVPEKAVTERIQAGLLHLDINTLGQEPDGDAMACVGAYAPIGSESAPMIQFFDSIGWHRLAERCLNFFLDRQREDGFIQNFGGYQSETGPALWTTGEHYRYTRDEQWVRRVKDKLLKSCDYLLRWRQRNKIEEMRGKAYGLIEGKVADPEDFFHSFMLNALSYLGLQRVSEMLMNLEPEQSRRLASEAAAFREDIRTAYYQSLARAPLVPLGDGTWAPTPPTWTENRGALALYAEGGNWFTHGAFGARDSLIGPLYLVIGEVLEPDEPGATFLLKTHQELMTRENAGLSQPYYCRHDFLHLKRGEIKAYLKTYYNQLSALQDRETYTFWEHYFFASQHKTHEEGWFLMQTRWMLFLEEGPCLSLLKAIPRAWLGDGQKIVLEKIATYFGEVSASITSRLAQNRIEATVECHSARKPQQLHVRLPHPERRSPISVEGGSYDPASETVEVAAFDGKAQIVLRF